MDFSLNIELFLMKQSDFRFNLTKSKESQYLVILFPLWVYSFQVKWYVIIINKTAYKRLRNYYFQNVFFLIMQTY